MPEAQPYGLNQQYGATNDFGRFDVDHVPQAVAELRRKYPEIGTWESAIWRASADKSHWSVKPSFPFIGQLGSPAKEFGFVAYLRESDQTLHFERLFSQYNPRSRRYDMVKLPAEVRKTGVFSRPGFKTLIIEHTHPFRYGFDNSIRDAYIKGPSQADFKLIQRNPDAFGIIQALDAVETRQVFYYGRRLYT